MLAKGQGHVGCLAPRQPLSHSRSSQLHFFFSSRHKRELKKMKTFFQRTARALASRTILKNNFIPQRVQVRLLARDTTVGNCQANDKAYRLFDIDGDGDLSPEELA